MATQVLAIGTGAADSGDVVIASGSELTVCLNDADGTAVAPGAVVDILKKDSNGQYFQMGQNAQLTSKDPCMVIRAAGTFLFRRRAGSPSCGVFSD